MVLLVMGNEQALWALQKASHSSADAHKTYCVAEKSAYWHEEGLCEGKGRHAA